MSNRRRRVALRRTAVRTRTYGGVAVLAAAVVAISACHDSSPTAASSDPPRNPPIVGALAVSIPPAGLTLRASYTVDNATAAVVLVQAVGVGAARRVVAPIKSGQASAIVTALEPGVKYTIQGVALNEKDSVRTALDTVTVAALPADLEGVQFPTSAPSTDSAFMLTTLARGTTNYALAFDRGGRIVWYRGFAGEGTGLGDLQQQPNGHFTMFLGNTYGWQPLPGKFVEFGPDGEVLREYLPPEGRYMDDHELRLRPDGVGGMDAYTIMYDIRPMDLTGHGGDASSTAAVHQIVRITASGEVQTIFDAGSRFTPDDWVSLPLEGLGDIDHPNAFDFAPDGGILVSWRNLSAVTKHDPVTGSVLWQLGGRQSTLTLEDDPLEGFSGQHSVRAIGPTGFLIYDNGPNHLPPETRAAQYEVDAATQKARLVWQFRHEPSLFTPFTGSVQRLADGRTFIGYSDGRCAMVRADGSLEWEGQLTVNDAKANTYRILRLPSLVEYEVP